MTSMSYRSERPSLVMMRRWSCSTRSSAPWSQRASSSAAVSASLSPRTRWGLNGWSTAIERLTNFSSGASSVTSTRSAARARRANRVSSPATPPPAITTRGREAGRDGPEVALFSATDRLERARSIASPPNRCPAFAVALMGLGRCALRKRRDRRTWGSVGLLTGRSARAWFAIGLVDGRRRRHRQD